MRYNYRYSQLMLDLESTIDQFESNLERDPDFYKSRQELYYFESGVVCNKLSHLFHMLYCQTFVPKRVKRLLAKVREHYPAHFMRDILNAFNRHWSKNNVS